MTNCVILAAGQGIRLRPYTNDRPKCFVELNGKPLIKYQLEVIKSAGIKNILIVSGYAPERIEKLGYPTIYNRNFKNTNMVTSLMLVEDSLRKFNGSDLLISYSDIVCESENIKRLLLAECEISILTDDSWLDLWSLRNANPLDDAETIKFTEANKITEIGKKPQSLNEIQSQFMGLIKVRHDKINEFFKAYHELDKYILYDGKNYSQMYMTSFIQELIGRGWDVRGTRTNGGWLEIDTCTDLDLYRSLQEKDKLKYFWHHDV